MYSLLRFMAHLSVWRQSFSRLYAVTRSALWERIDLLTLLKSYGTAVNRNDDKCSLKNQTLGQNFPDYLHRFHSGEALVEALIAINETLMIHSHTMENRGIDLVDVHRIGDSIVGKIIGLS